MLCPFNIFVTLICIDDKRSKRYSMIISSRRPCFCSIACQKPKWWPYKFTGDVYIVLHVGDSFEERFTSHEELTVERGFQNNLLKRLFFESTILRHVHFNNTILLLRNHVTGMASSFRHINTGSLARGHLIWPSDQLVWHSIGLNWPLKFKGLF